MERELGLTLLAWTYIAVLLVGFQLHLYLPSPKTTDLFD